MRFDILKARRAFAAAVAAALNVWGAIGVAHADAVTDWNATAAALPIAAPPVMARVMATMHGAVYDAVNAIEPRYETYRFQVKAPAGASEEAAAATAAHAVLVALVPSQKGGLTPHSRSRWPRSATTHPEPRVSWSAKPRPSTFWPGAGRTTSTPRPRTSQAPALASGSERHRGSSRGCCRNLAVSRRFCSSRLISTLQSALSSRARRSREIWTRSGDWGAPQ